MAPRKTRQRLNLEIVVDEAAKLGDKVGIESLSLSALADRLGVRPPSLYNHIASLDDLQRHLSIRGLQKLTEAIEKALAAFPEQSPSTTIGRATREFANMQPTLFQYATYRLSLRKAERKRYGERLLRITCDAYKESLGPNARSDTDTVQYFVRSLVYGFIALELNGGLEPADNPDLLYDKLLEIADTGIRSLATR